MQDRPRLGGLIRTWRRAAVVTLAAAALLLLWSLFVRSSTVGTPFSFAGLTDLQFDPYYFGLAAQELAIPVLLVLLFSRTRLFRRSLEGIPEGFQSWRLILVLVGIQLLTFFYRVALASANNTWVTFGLFIVFVAGILGGWRAGLVVGLVAAVCNGLLAEIAWNGESPFVLGAFVEYSVLKSILAIGAAWLGATVGLVSEAEPAHQRTAPPAIFGLGVLVYLLFVLGAWISFDDPSYFLELLLPGIVVTGLAIVAFTLMVRGVQHEEVRHRAETTALALTQTNLVLTRTRLALAEAELRALHAQINPHFFFNALNTIRYFIRTDPDTARRLLTQVSELFQRALNAGEFVSLSDEISHVQAYLALEKARLEERLTVVWTNLAKEELDRMVPTLILQPIVENAVIHGVAPKTTGGTIHIVINRVADDLLIQVDDDGMGFDPAATPAALPPSDDRDGHSIGLRNVDERLRLLYGDAYRLTLESAPGEGTRVVVRVPVDGDRRAGREVV